MKNIYDIFSVAHKRVLITGAANGNGMAIAKAFGDAGSQLFLIDIDQDNLMIVASDIEKKTNTIVKKAVVDLSDAY
jgi:short-subunit dehydrogenase